MLNNTPLNDPQTARASLQVEFSRFGWLGALALLVAAGMLGVVWQWQSSGQWILQAGVLWAFVCFQTHRRLTLNRPEAEAPLYGELGWGNRLTLLRAWLIATVGGFLFQPWPEGPALAWLPGMLYFGAAVLDRIDGYVARKTRHSSLLGHELDMVCDALGLAVASLLAFGYGQVHWSYLLLGVAYYVFHGGILWRRSRGLPVYALPPALHRRAWAGFQMGFLVAALWPLFYPPITTLAGFAFMLPALVGFVIDWLTVSGLINRSEDSVDQFFQRLTFLSVTILQPALRVAVVSLLAGSVLLHGWPLLPDVVATGPHVLMAAGLSLAAFLILLGIAGRAACLLLIGLVGWYCSGSSLLRVDFVLFCSAIWLMLLGTGRFSLWQEDGNWIYRYDGK